MTPSVLSRPPHPPYHSLVRPAKRQHHPAPLLQHTQLGGFGAGRLVGHVPVGGGGGGSVGGEHELCACVPAEGSTAPPEPSIRACCPSCAPSPAQHRALCIQAGQRAMPAASAAAVAPAAPRAAGSGGRGPCRGFKEESDAVVWQRDVHVHQPILHRRLGEAEGRRKFATTPPASMPPAGHQYVSTHSAVASRTACAAATCGQPARPPAHRPRLHDVVQPQRAQRARHVNQRASEGVLPRPLVRHVALELLQQVGVGQQLRMEGKELASY